MGFKILAGRPRQFDKEQALKTAMLMFWENGFEGTSVDDLAAAIGIGKPSLYSAFGPKEQIFSSAVDLYIELYGVSVVDCRTAREAIEERLRRSSGAFSESGLPSGCFVVLGAIGGSQQSAEVRALLARKRIEGTLHFADRIRRGIRDGDVPKGADADLMAEFYSSVLNGMAVQTRDGASAPTLERIVDAAMASWSTLASLDTAKSASSS